MNSGIHHNLKILVTSLTCQEHFDEHKTANHGVATGITLYVATGITLYVATGIATGITL